MNFFLLLNTKDGILKIVGNEQFMDPKYLKMRLVPLFSLEHLPP